MHVTFLVFADDVISHYQVDLVRIAVGRHQMWTSLKEKLASLLRFSRRIRVQPYNLHSPIALGYTDDLCHIFKKVLSAFLLSCRLIQLDSCELKR